MRFYLLLPVMLLVLHPLRAGEESYRNDAHGFTFTLSSRFLRKTELETGKILYAFSRPPTLDGENGILITIERLGGTIGREPIDFDRLKERHPTATLLSLTWNEFPISAIRIPEVIDGVRTVTYNVQIPLIPEAIQIKISGAESNEREVYTLLGSVVASTQGKTNWFMDEKRAESGTKRLMQLVLLVGIAFGVLIGLWHRLERRKSKHVRGTV
jgi:hypothetical protein